MSRAFDTISREILLKILRTDVALDDDEYRICQSLLAETNLRAKFGETMSAPFQSTIGTPQGDGLSPILFAIYLEHALRDIRCKSYTLRPLNEIRLNFPSEAIYADDCDFISQCQK